MTRKAETDLEIQTGYVYIGKITGAGAGNPPAVFNMGAQVDLSSGFVFDINQIARQDIHGDWKVRVRADSDDIDEKQIEVQNASGIPTFYVNEIGNCTIADDTHQGGVLYVGEAANAGDATAASVPAHIDHGILNSASVLNHLTRVTGYQGAGTSPEIHFFAHKNGNGGIFTINAKYNGATSLFSKDVTSVEAIGIEVKGGDGSAGTIKVMYRDAANNSTWTATTWDAAGGRHLVSWALNSPAAVGLLTLISNLTMTGVLDIAGTTPSHIDRLTVDQILLASDGALETNNTYVQVGSVSSSADLEVYNDLVLLAGSRIKSDVGQIIADDPMLLNSTLRVTGETLHDAAVKPAAGSIDLGSASLVWRYLYATAVKALNSDGYQYQTAQGFTHWIDGSEFVFAGATAGGDVVLESNIGFVGQGPQSLYGSFLIDPQSAIIVSGTAAIRLPQGAAITGVDLIGTSNHATKTSVGIIRQAHAISNATVVESLCSTALPAGTNPTTFPVVAIGVLGTPFVFPLPVNQNLTVDNTLYKYMIKVWAEGTAGALFVSGIRIYYELTKLKP